MAYGTDWSLPAHTSDTEKQRAFKGRGGVLQIDRGDGGCNPFHEGANKAPRKNLMARHGHGKSTGK